MKRQRGRQIVTILVLVMLMLEISARMLQPETIEAAEAVETTEITETTATTETTEIHVAKDIGTAEQITTYAEDAPPRIVVEGKGSEDELLSNHSYGYDIHMVLEEDLKSLTIYREGEVLKTYNATDIADAYHSITISQEENPYVYKIVAEDNASQVTAYENVTVEAFTQNIEFSGNTVTGTYGDDIKVTLNIKNTNTYSGADVGSTDLLPEGEGEIVLNSEMETSFISGNTDNFSIPENAQTVNYTIGAGESATFDYTVVSVSEPGTYQAKLKVPYTPRTRQNKYRTIELSAVVTKRSLENVTVTVPKSKVYDGTTTVTGIGAVAFDNVVSGDEVFVSADGVYDNATGGTGKTITITFTLSGKDAYKYETPEPQTITNGVITQADGTASFEISDSYFGQKLSYTMSSDTNGTDHVTLFYKKSGELLYSNTVPTAAGTYDVKAVFAQTANYKEVTVKKSFTILRFAATADMYEITGTKGKNDWYISAVTITGKNDNQVSLTEDGIFDTTVTIDKSGSHQIYIKTPTGAITEAVNLPEYKIDLTAPEFAENEGIMIGNSKWNKFLETVTFGIYKRNEQTGSIRAHDNESNILETSYYISSKALSYKKVQTLTDFTPGSEFVVGGNTPSNYVVYAKIENNAGLVTWISSDGMVIDNAAPTVLGVEEGKSYAPQKLTITVTDYCLSTVKLNGIKQKIKDNKVEITLYPGAEDKAYTLISKDKSGNSSEYTFTLKRAQVIFGAGWIKLEEEKAYRLKSGTWRVSGDRTSYQGGSIFYVDTNDKFEFIQE